MSDAAFSNPFRAGAGHRPPYLAGRRQEREEFAKLLQQSIITDNLVLTGLRGVGKTVLLDELKPMALSAGWLWVGGDLSESASITEANLAQRILTDLAVATSAIRLGLVVKPGFGFTAPEATTDVYLTYDVLSEIYNGQPGLVLDKLKAVMSVVADSVRTLGARGIVFAYDEAQNLADHAAKDQFPLSTMLDLFQSLQKSGVPFLLVLVGLPTLFPKLVDVRTFAERMFRVVFLKQLNRDETLEAIRKPIEDAACPVSFDPNAIDSIYRYSAGYPYFVQFICRESYDFFLQQLQVGRSPAVPITAIIRKLDTDFFAGRWSRVTDRQQELLFVIASLDSADEEFTIQEVLTRSENLLAKPFSRSHINQILASLISAGLIYRDRHGKYLFAVPLLADFIKRVIGPRF